jgi:hypothetical protein
MANQNPIGSATGTLSDGTEDVSYSFSKEALLAGFSDPDYDTLEIASIWADSGELTDLGNGQWSMVVCSRYQLFWVGRFRLFGN